MIYHDRAVLFPCRCAPPASHTRGPCSVQRRTAVRRGSRGQQPVCLPAALLALLLCKFGKDACRTGMPSPLRRRLSDTVRISQSVKAAVAQKASLPFELKVLEALLAGGARWTALREGVGVTLGA